MVMAHYPTRGQLIELAERLKEEACWAEAKKNMALPLNLPPSQFANVDV
jgi:hypothetical protein